MPVGIINGNLPILIHFFIFQLQPAKSIAKIYRFLLVITDLTMCWYQLPNIYFLLKCWMVA